MIHRGVTALAVALLAACHDGSDGGASPAPAPVTVLSTPCPSGPGTIPSSSCVFLEVAPPGLAPKQVELRITEPDAGVTPLGTVLLCTGANGEFFFSDLSGGPELIADLTAIGLRALDRRWLDGWLAPEYELRRVSERMAVLLDWIVANEHRGGAFHAVGNSGGSGELAYSLTDWNREALFDAVVFGSGPVFSRIDYLCLPPAPEWSAMCPSFLPAFECGVPPCSAPLFNPLCVQLAGRSQAELLADSLLHSGADLDYGAAVHFVIGAGDCTEWVAQALLFESAVTSEHTLQLVPSTPHTICAAPEGRAAIVEALLGLVDAPARARPPRVEVTIIELEER